MYIKKIIAFLNKFNDNFYTTSKGIFEWDNNESRFYLIENNATANIDILHNIEKQKKSLLKNTLLFAQGKNANNALLWGSRGTGKSSLVIAVYRKVSRDYNLSLLEIKTNQIRYLNSILRKLESNKKKYIIFCDDFSFLPQDENFILFKNIIDGTVSRNKNIIYYVTSNYRNIIKETIDDKSDTLKKQEIEDDHAALSDRFGLWLGFENFDQKKYLQIVKKYCELYNIKVNKKIIEKKAVQWSILRGSLSGREALHFVKNLKNKNI